MMCTTRTSGVSGWPRGEEQVTERNIFTPWIVLTGATVSSNGGGAAGKEVSPKHRCSSCLKHFLFPGDQRQDVGGEGRGAEEDAGDVGADAGGQWHMTTRDRPYPRTLSHLCVS